MAAAGDSDTRMFTARLAEPLYLELKNYAFFTDTSMNEVVVRALREFFDRNGPDERIDALVEQARRKFRGLPPQ